MAISEAELLSLLNLPEEDLLWLLQALFSGTLWILGEFADDMRDPTESEEEDMSDVWESLAY